MKKKKWFGIVLSLLMVCSMLFQGVGMTVFAEASGNAYASTGKSTSKELSSIKNLSEQSGKAVKKTPQNTGSSKTSLKKGTGTILYNTVPIKAFKTIGGVTVHVNAPAGSFPKGTVLSISPMSSDKAKKY